MQQGASSRYKVQQAVQQEADLAGAAARGDLQQTMRVGGDLGAARSSGRPLCRRAQQQEKGISASTATEAAMGDTTTRRERWGYWLGGFGSRPSDVGARNEE